MGHISEPWYLRIARRDDGTRYYIVGADHELVIMNYRSLNNDADKANALRIVTCVNACAGISNEELEAGEISVTPKAVKHA